MAVRPEEKKSAIKQPFQAQAASPASKSFDDLTTEQQFLAYLVMFVLNTTSTDEAEASVEDVSPIAQFLSVILGFESPQEMNRWKSSAQGKDWKRSYNFNKFDFANAQELAHGKIEIGARQKAVMNVLGDAAATAGVSEDFLIGLWGVESRFGKTRTSPTGCKGDFQFTQRTFAAVIRDNGDEIAARLRAKGMTKEADAVASSATALKRGANQFDQNLQNLRENPYIATYAAAFYAKQVAEEVGVDPTEENSWGKMYAGYNIGPGNARKLDASLLHQANVKHSLGSVAYHNPMFFKQGATGGEALENYHEHIAARRAQFERAVAGSQQKPDEPATVIAAKEDPTSTTSFSGAAAGAPVTIAKQQPESFVGPVQPGSVPVTVAPTSKPPEYHIS